jgi:hypothetical protein
MVDRRRFDRKKVTAEVDYRSGWKAERAVAYDLSTHGCMLHSSRGFVEPGDTIVVRFTQSVTVEGKVIWQQNRTAGIEFASPVHPLIVSHLSFRDDKAELNETLGRDRFGRPLLGPRKPRRFVV